VSTLDPNALTGTRYFNFRPTTNTAYEFKIANELPKLKPAVVVFGR